MILNLEDMPRDPVRAVIWLDGVLEQTRTELDAAYAEAYFAARIEGRLVDAVRAGRTSMKKALALTRRRNEQSGRTIRWGDGLDPLSRRAAARDEPGASSDRPARTPRTS